LLGLRPLPHHHHHLGLLYISLKSTCHLQNPLATLGSVPPVVPQPAACWNKGDAKKTKRAAAAPGYPRHHIPPTVTLPAEYDREPNTRSCRTCRKKISPPTRSGSNSKITRTTLLPLPLSNRELCACLPLSAWDLSIKPHHKVHHQVHLQRTAVPTPLRKEHS